MTIIQRPGNVPTGGALYGLLENPLNDGGFFLYGALTVLSEWKNIRATPVRKLCFLPLFPLFMLTYIPITVAALFQKVEWKPIAHKSVRQLDQAA